MTSAVRRLTRYSEDPQQLAGQVAELARDVEQRSRLQITLHEWKGPIVLGKQFRLAAPAGKPDAVMCVAVEDITNRGHLVPAGIQWSWQSGYVQIDDTQIGFAAGDIYRVTFMVLTVEGS